jgi:hypothetical protein
MLGAVPMPAITFDGIDDGLTTADGMIVGTQTYTFAAIAADRRPSVATFDIETIYSTTTCQLQANGGFVAYLGTAAASMRNPGSFAGSSTANTIRVNGAEQTVLSNTFGFGPETSADRWFVWSHVVQSRTFNFDDRGLRLGRADDGTGTLCNAGNVSLGELVVFDGALSTQQIATVEEYLFHKWRVIH